MMTTVTCHNSILLTYGDGSSMLADLKSILRWSAGFSIWIRFFIIFLFFRTHYRDKNFEYRLHQMMLLYRLHTHTQTLFRCISFLHVESNKKKLLIPKKGCWLLLMILFDKKFFLKIKLTNNIFKVKSFNYSINLTKLPIDVVHEIIFAFWHTPQCENTVENHLFKPRRYLSKSCCYLFCI